MLTAENDATRSSTDIPRYERLFGRTPEMVNLGQLGHAAVLVDPDAYADLIECVLR